MAAISPARKGGRIVERVCSMLGVGPRAGRRILGANERLDVGVIGSGGEGRLHLPKLASENVVALCDVDEDRLEASAQVSPDAERYVDYRKLLDSAKMDAVVIATPDHHHAPAAVRALHRGLHVYCEKPLAHTPAEARLLAQIARSTRLATQMGTQQHECPSHVRAVELLRAGVLGPVREVHVRTDRPGEWWRQGGPIPSDRPAAPSRLHWDLWLGPARQRPYHPAYGHFSWRGWWDFGCGAVGDMGVHLMDPAFWGLDLSGPVRIWAEGPAPSPEFAPTAMRCHFEFGSRGEAPPCKVHWYEGEAVLPAAVERLVPMNGSLFVGDEGMMAVDYEGEPRLTPAEKFADVTLPEPSIPRWKSIHQQWFDACKYGGPTSCNFPYAAALTEILLLANIAYRTGRTIEWNPASFRIPGAPSANHLLSKEYRPGWAVETASVF